MRGLVEMLAPSTALRASAFLQSKASPQVVSAAKDKGRIYDPECGSVGMFVSSARSVSKHQRQAAAGHPRPSDGRRAGGEGYSGAPSKELSIHGVEKTDETGRLSRRVAVR